jgi:glyceraldehyde 3-phosphate dehydrogenase
MSISIGICGFGRIGRLLFRQCIQSHNVRVCAVSDCLDAIENFAYLLRYDSTYGPLSSSVEVGRSGQSLICGEQEIVFNCTKCIDDINWSALGADIVFDCSGVQANATRASNLLNGRCKHVVITHVPTSPVDLTVIMGINEEQLGLSKSAVISASICDANAICHLIKAIDSFNPITSGFITTLHPWLAYQGLLDGPIRSQAMPSQLWGDFALGRASTNTLIPKSTTVIHAIEMAMPQFSGRFSAMSFRVPTSNVCGAELTLLLQSTLTKEELNDDLINYFTDSRYVQLNQEPLVSLDYRGRDSSVTIDLQWTDVAGGRLAKVVAWYDNEWGYVCRLLDVAQHIERSTAPDS